MIRLRKADSRGRFRNDWLDARFSFSFGNYRDPAYDGYGDLLVLNDDRVAPGGGFREHPHAEMEVMSYPLAGAIEHRDSLGRIEQIRPGDVHRMRAGTGIRHSEMNASAVQPERHLQWWIRPAERGLRPAYARIHVPRHETHNRLRLIGSPDGSAGSLEVAQDVRVYALTVRDGSIAHRPPAGRRGFLHVAAGTVVLNGVALADGDGAFIEDEPVLTIAAANGASGEALLFDLRP